VIILSRLGQLEVGGVKGEGTDNPSPETTPATGSQLVPALCSRRAQKAPHPPAWADTLAPRLCHVQHVPGLQEDSPAACSVTSFATTCMEEELVRERSQV